MGYKTIKNVCDFVCYNYPYMYLLECKSTKGNTFNFNKLTQYDDLKKSSGIKGINSGVVIWFIEHKKVIYVPIEECVRLKEVLNLKSINIKMVGDKEFSLVDLPGKLKRLHIDVDYSVLNSILESRHINLEKE